jgi:hypothetical protein
MDSSWNLICSYDFPGRIRTKVDQPIEMAYNYDTIGDPDMGFRPVLGSIDLDSELLGDLAIVKRAYGSDYSNPGVPPPVEVYYSTWFLCAQTYAGLTANAAGLNPMLSSTERLFPAPSSTADPAFRSLYRANSSGKLFGVRTWSPHFYTLISLFNTSVPYEITYDEEEAHFGQYLYSANISLLTQNIADTFSGLLRNLELGDNDDATTLKGKAHYNVIFVQVRWPWLILPLAETLLTVLLLTFSIALTRQQPLLKSSSIALLMHPLDGWSEEELELRSSGPAEQLEHMAKDMTVSFEDNGRDRPKFVRVESDRCSLLKNRSTRDQ